MAVAGVPLLLYAFSSGPPAEHTGGFGEPTCVQCHFPSGGVGVNQGAGSVTITIRDSGGGDVVAAYRSGGSYQITVRVADPQRTNPGQSRWGFQLSARTLDGQQAGNLSRADSTTQCASPSPPNANPCQPTFNGIQYIEHTSSGTRAGTPLGVNFVFNWTAPDVSAGPVIFHAAGNAANNSGTELGDRIYVACRSGTTCNPNNAAEIGVVLPPEPSGPPPVISTGGIVNIASLAGAPAPLAPGSLVAISGANLTEGSRHPAPAFSEDGKISASLGGASVAINGIAAPVLLAFPERLAIQLPYELGGQENGSLVVTVGGQASAAQNIALASAAPGIFTLNQQGTGQGAIFIAGTRVLAAPSNGNPDERRPARRGERITIYCTGLGAVSPPVETGALAGFSETSPRATVLIDGLPAEVPYSGTAPGFVGLYQVDAVVPSGASIGDAISLVVTAGGRASNTVTFAVGP